MSNFADLLEFEYPWPNKGDRLLSDEGLWPTSVTIDRWDQTFNCFVWTFTNAAETLIQSVVAGKQPAARIIWPVLHLYRHAIELALKVCIKEASEFLGEDTQNSGHQLCGLKDILFGLLRSLDMPVDDDTALGFTSVLNDLDQIDPNGTAFRYPKKLNGKSHGLEGRSIDLLDFQRGAKKILNFLDCVSEEITQRSTY